MLVCRTEVLSSRERQCTEKQNKYSLYYLSYLLCRGKSSIISLAVLIYKTEQACLRSVVVLKL